MIEAVKSRYPDIELGELYPHFPRMAVPTDPALSGYSWQDCYRGFFGAGGLFLVSEVARELALKPGMRVLDLCCGTGMSSIYLTKHSGVQVIALDRDVDPTENWRRIEAERLAGAITPMRMDARDIRLPENYFLCGIVRCTLATLVAPTFRDNRFGASSDFAENTPKGESYGWTACAG